MAKEKIMDKLKEVKFKSEKEKELYINWINAESTIFGEADVEGLLLSVISNQKIDEKKTNKSEDK